MRQSHLFISNAAVMWAARVLLVIPQLIFVPYLIGTIGESAYGAYALVWSLVMAFEQLQMSLQSGVVKYTAGFLAQGKVDEVNGVVSSSFVYSLLLASLACAATLVAGRSFDDPTGQLGPALIVVGTMALFIFPLTPFVAVIQSRQRYYVGAIADTVSRYLGLIAVVAWFRVFGPSVAALMVITAGMLFLARLSQVPVAYKLVPGLRYHPRHFSRASFKLITAFGAVIVVASACIAVNSAGVRWVMASLTSTAFVAHMAIMLMPASLLSQVMDPMTVTVMSATSAYDATGNQIMLRELLVRGLRYTAVVALAGLVVAAILMRSVLALWVGSAYTFLAPYTLVLFASTAFMGSTSVAHHMLKGLGKLWSVVFIYGTGLVVVPFGVIFGTFYLSGDPYLAVTAGLAAGQVVCGCLHVVFCSRAVGTTMGELLLRSYVPSALVAAGVAVATGGVVAVIGIDGVVGRAAIAFLALVAFGAGCYAFVATPAERQTLRELTHLALSRASRIRQSLFRTLSET